MPQTINLSNPTALTAALLVGDPQTFPNGSNDALPTLPQVNGQPISAGIGLLSTGAAIQFPVVTTAERNALNAYNGMIVYNSDTTTFDGYFGSPITAWQSIAGEAVVIDKVELQNGTAAAPSMTFINDLTTGVYLNSVGDLGFSVEGVAVGAFPQPAQFAVYGHGSSPAFISLNNETNTFAVALEAPPSSSLTANLLLTLPSSHPPINGVPMVSDSAGNLSFPLGGMQFVTGHVTAAQIDGMYAAPVEILTPLTGMGIIVHKFAIQYGTGTAPTGGGNIFLQWTSIAGTTNYNVTNNITAASLTGAGVSSQIAIANGKEYLGATAAGNPTSNGIYLTNDTGAFVGGTINAQVFVWYSYVSLNPLP